jgi:hypothetical protein
MDTRRLEELLWKRVDGELGADERRELEAALETDGALELKQQVEACASRLQALAAVPPPADLRPRIAQDLEIGPPATTAHRASWRAPLLALAAGLVIGVIGSHLVSIDRSLVPAVHPDQASGAMVPMAARTPIISELADGLGRLEMRFDDRRLELDVSVGRPAAVTVEGREQPRLVTSQHIDSTNGQLAVTDAGVAFITDGPGRWIVVLETPPAAWPLRVSVSTGGRIVFDRTLTPGALDENR